MAASDYESPYDQDRPLIDKFVEYIKNPENDDKAQWIFNYYSENLKIQIQNLIAYIFSSQADKDVEIKDAYIGTPPSEMERRILEAADRDFARDLKNVRTKFQVYQDVFWNKMTEISQLWDSSGQQVVPLEQIMRLYYYVSFVYCLVGPQGSYRRSFTLPLTKTKVNLFPYFESQGLFGLNTYLYAMFNGVFLVGFSPKITNYDLLTTCPEHFTHHDFFHADVINKYGNLNPRIEKLYYSIINHPDMMLEERDLHIFVMWFIIHETKLDLFKFYSNRYQHKNDDFLYGVIGHLSSFDGVYRDFDEDLYLFYDKVFKNQADMVVRYIVELRPPKSVIEEKYNPRSMWAPDMSRSDKEMMNFYLSNPGKFAADFPTVAQKMVAETEIVPLTDNKIYRQQLEDRINEYRQYVRSIPKSAFIYDYKDDFGQEVKLKKIEKMYRSKLDDSLKYDNVRQKLLLLACFYSFMVISDTFVHPVE